MSPQHAAPRRTVPALEEPRALPEPEVAERTLSTGLKVVAVRRGTVPLVEIRLRIPFAGSAAENDVSVAAVLANTVLSGTEAHTNVELAAELQKIGGGLSVGVDPDRLVISGNTLSDGLGRLLEILNEVLTSATYPEREVGTERERLADRIQIAFSQPAQAVRRALLRRIYDSHPYSIETPEPEQVRAIESPAVRALHAERVLPVGSVLVLVGNIDPDATLDLVERTLGGWSPTGVAHRTPPVPPLTAGPLLLVHRPGSVQSSLRLALPALPRAHADYAAFQLANLVFGGYFSSRLVENIREDKGYTYSPHSSVDHSAAGSVTLVSADVATEVTAPALLEIEYELGRIATLPPTAEELEQARQYAIGTLALSVSSQAGLAGMLIALAGTGLDLNWLAEHPIRLAKVTLEEVAAAAAGYLAPSGGVTVVLGDAEAVSGPLGALGPVDRS
ncbi:M16 family metallopeptidase [Cryptosporangium aurantiacum]|uniref:Predicted Zn-dependent peptidase n=1 Tax=Cryptosporangium aurantiacum TaxID=134849 RepID=A0A1M7QN68_9ACTN|nr:pitrilysin family protein [Cryptosporangium aurantiacum]SHN32929.1 Predicted Zn-dependent peptidase [Cryptosporangium aurantiacum]